MIQTKRRRHTPTIDEPRPAARSDNDLAIASLQRSQAVIEFDVAGTIIDANDNFLSAMGYRLDEIVDEHHRMFVDPIEAESAPYAAFWRALEAGEFRSGEFRRISKSGADVWIQATYNPVIDDDGRVVRILKFATDITSQNQARRDVQDRTQGRIEFLPDGTIITANDLFLSVVGYEADEVRGRHHRMFMPPGEADTDEYASFWSMLGAGEFRRGQFHRVGRDGRERWLHGAYNPEFDTDGNVVRVVKTVSDITDQVEAKVRSDESASTIAQGVTEMATSIDESSQAVAATAGLARNTERHAIEATGRVSTLEQVSSSIEHLVELIQGLAERTNLLALNATIEAAHAGDSGRGFAVVADEVKSLANQTGTAATQISRSVTDIQSEVAAVVSIMSDITTSASDVAHESAAAASAIEQQAAVVSQMSTSATQLLHRE